MLTREQITHFHALGFVNVPNVLSAEEVEEFSRRFNEIIERGDSQGDDSDAGARIFPQGHRVIIPLVEADPYFYKLLDHPNLAAVAEDLLGEDCLFTGISDGQIHNGDTHWHRDGGTPGPAIEAKLTFYLDDVAPGRGCLSFIPGSHLWPLHYKDLQTTVEGRALGYPLEEFPGRYDLPAGKGDVLAFHTRIWHSSWGGGANRRQMAWMMRTAPGMQWEVDKITENNKKFAEHWFRQSGGNLRDQFIKSADERRMKKIRYLTDIDSL